MTTEDIMTMEELFALPRVHVSPELGAVYDEVGAGNIWIKRACDPPFKGAEVRLCADRRELRSWLMFGNWCNGSAFAIEAGEPAADGRRATLAFIQQGECSDEWLAVKSVPTAFKGRPAHMYAEFDSISWYSILTRPAALWTFDDYLDGMTAASLDECRSGDYMKSVHR